MRRISYIAVAQDSEFNLELGFDHDLRIARATAEATSRRSPLHRV
jgi:hypothetical protein